ncbi:unnamed protein product [Brassica napus]|uniref:(rape) hypothetical protein n=1 Tax=Brassica napus TaxID=3708 RepID=A0A816KB17_BRANA|nr:unnamed protein product [Brassica napus]
MEGRLPLLSAASSVLVSFVLEAYINSPSREGFYNVTELFLSADIILLFGTSVFFSFQIFNRSDFKKALKWFI